MNNFENISNPNQEKPKIPETLTGQETADLAEQLYSKCSPEFAKSLVHSNVALTMAGLKPQTEFFVDIENQDQVKEIQEDVKKINAYLANEKLKIKFVAVEEAVEPERSHEKPSIMVGIFNLNGFERISKTSTISGVEPFESSLGFEDENFTRNKGIPGIERIQQWALRVLENLKRAQSEGKIPNDADVEIIFEGLEKGYPDQAVIDFSRAYTNKNMGDLEVVPIRGIATYDEAQPVYDVFPENMDDPAIRENVRQAEEILDAFYSSDWHQGLNLEKYKKGE